MKKLSILLLFLSSSLAFSQNPSKKDYIILSFEYDSSTPLGHIRGVTYWLCDIEDLKTRWSRNEEGIRIYPFFMDFSHSYDLEAHIDSESGNIHFDQLDNLSDFWYSRWKKLSLPKLEGVYEDFFSIVRDHSKRKWLQTIKDKAPGHKNTIHIYATPVSGIFIEGYYYPYDDYYNGKAFMPYGELEYNPSLVGTDEWVYINNGDYTGVDIGSLSGTSCPPPPTRIGPRARIVD